MSEKCNGHCRPTPCFAHGRRLVRNLYPDGPYDREQLHSPCNIPGCDAARKCRELDDEDAAALGKTSKPQTSMGDSDLDDLEAKVRERLARLGLN